MKKILYYILFLVIVLPFLIFNLTLIIKSKLYPDKIADFMGYKPFIVMSGSMETTINIGDLVIVKKVNSSSIHIGDIIAFKNGNIVISHRVKEVINDSGIYKFKTKGDNNNVADDFIVSSDAIEGIFVNKIPGLGSILLFLGKPIGLLMVILVIIIVSTALYFVKFGYSTKDAELMREFQEFKRNKELNNNK
ncbi:MAG: signal peptidase I [Clostridiales bacterium]|jgi:signal peptidase I|nr:signal peptidase I [Clostridiales bacterium]